MAMTENEIAVGCQKNNNQARKELYERYAGAMFALILRYQPEQETARDILHDGFIRIFTNIDKFTFRGEGSLKAWMSRIFVNEVLSALRAKDILRHAADIEETPMEERIISDDETQNIPSEKIFECIQELPVGYRTVFNMFAIDGLSHKEISAMLNISEKTSSSQYFHAKQQLSKKLKNLIKN